MDLSAVPRYIPPPTNYRRIIGFGIVVVLHVVVIYAFVTGLAQLAIDRLKGPMETRLIEEAKQETEEPPPPPPKFQAPPPVFVPMPDVAITEPPSESAAITNTTSQRPVAPPPPVAKADVIIPPRTNPRRPNTGAEDIYPAMSRRLGEEGTTVLLLTVTEDGKVSDAKVQTSSGFERLDEAAQKEAVRSWRFLPGTVNGKAAAMQMPIRVTFKMQK